MSLANRLIAPALVMTVLLSQSRSACAQTNGDTQLNLDHQPIAIAGDHSEQWQDGDTTVTAIIGNRNNGGLALLTQGHLQFSGEVLVVVDTPTSDGRDVRVYGENRVRLVSHGQSDSYASHHLRLSSRNNLQIQTETQSIVADISSRMLRGLRHMDPQRRALSPVSASRQLSQQIPQIGQPSLPNSERRIRVRPRSNQQLRFESFRSRDTVPEEQVYVITGGVNILISGVRSERIDPGILDLSADRVIVWTTPNNSDLRADSDLLQTSNDRLKVYLEGNIVVRQGDNRITASHAYYDAQNDQALLLNAELRAFLPGEAGQVRLRAEKLRQLAYDRFHASNAWTTTSPYGKPGYRLQASDIFVEPGEISPFTNVDPQTGLPKNGRAPLWITAQNSQFVFGDVPLLSIPRLTFPAEDPNIPLRSASIRQDRIFGFQVKTVWNLSKILGQRKVSGMQWDLNLDHKTERGPSVGIEGRYDTFNNFGRAIGRSTLIYQYDDGLDTLGLGRNSVPTEPHRGGIISRHMQQLPSGATVFGEIGFLSDRNYLESYDENRFDSDKDVETILGVKQSSGAWAGSLFGKVELNEFETSTDWLPRADLFAFSQPLLPGLLYYSSRSSAGYARQEPARPTDTILDPFTPLGIPYATDFDGIAAVTRHQIDAPMFLGPLKVVPFVMGEAAFWGDSATGGDINRTLVSGGVQASLSATRVVPEYQNRMFNLNGLAHRSQLSVEYRVTDSSEDFGSVPQLNDLDDNAQERFRYRYPLQIFSGLIPAEFDPRFYAVRAGVGSSIASPQYELATDQQVVRLAWRNRLQTKVGGPGNWRIRDWMLWEAGLTYFPDAARDNFGEDFGLIHGSYRWNLNDRTSFLAHGVFDLFQNSQEVWNVGLLSQRSTRGSIYLGYRNVTVGDFLDSETLVGSYSYRMSTKWISTGQISYDIAEGESRGASLTFSRIGLDFVMHFGFGIDTSKDNVGVAFAIEPRFGPPTPTNMSYLLGLEQ